MMYEVHYHGHGDDFGVLGDIPTFCAAVSAAHDIVSDAIAEMIDQGLDPAKELAGCEVVTYRVTCDGYTEYERVGAVCMAGPHMIPDGSEQ